MKHLFKNIKDERWLSRYLRFVGYYKDKEYDGVHKHHILPKSLYPEYSNLKENLWNRVDLPVRAHLIAHYMLANALGDNMWFAYNNMNAYHVRLSSRLYESATKKVSEQQSVRAKEWYKNNPHPKGNLGNLHSEKTKKSMSVSMLKFFKNMSEEERRKYNSKRKETRKTNGTDKCSVKTKIKLSLSMMGHKVTQETKDKISKTKKRKFKNGEYNFTKSEVSKQKMSVIMKEYYKKNGHHLRGKSYEEIHGVEEANRLRENVRRRMQKEVEIDGIIYKSWGGEAEEQTGKSYYKLKQIVNKDKGKWCVEIGGIEFRNATEAGRYWGISVNTVKSILKGESIRTLTIDGVFYVNKKTACDNLGISIYKLNKLIKGENDIMGSIRIK